MRKDARPSSQWAGGRRESSVRNCAEWTLEVDPTTVRAEVNAKVFGLTTYGQQPDASLFSQPAVSQIGTTTITWDFWLPKTSIPVNL